MAHVWASPGERAWLDSMTYFELVQALDNLRDWMHAHRHLARECPDTWGNLLDREFIMARDLFAFTTPQGVTR